MGLLLSKEHEVNEKSGACSGCAGTENFFFTKTPYLCNIYT